MHLRSWFLIGLAASVALMCGCPGKSTTAAGPVTPAELQPVTIESTTTASQPEQAAGFPEDTFLARCVSVGSGERSDRHLSVNERVIWVYRDGELEHPQERLSFDRVYYYREQSVLDDYMSLAIILDDAIYFVHRKNGGDFIVNSICTLTADLERLGQRDNRNHAAELKAYLERRRAAEEGAVAERKVAREEAYNASREARLARLQDLVSVRVASATASDPDDNPKVIVIATLEDGSTMEVKPGTYEFIKTFNIGVERGEASMKVEVWSYEDEDIRAEGEFAYTYDRERTFECRGAPGKSGMEYDSARGMYYHGRRGDHGPPISVEITTTGHDTADGFQVLHYRLACDGRTQSFLVSSYAKVSVATYGGNGGYGVQLANGNGGNGGNGGDGGDIDVTVDPSVRRYNLTTLSQGGRGGAPSSAEGQTNVNAYGTRGDDGAEGTISETRAPVSRR